MSRQCYRAYDGSGVAVKVWVRVWTEVAVSATVRVGITSGIAVLVSVRAIDRVTVRPYARTACALQVEQLDVCSLASVSDFAARWGASERPLHVLINNAGVMSYGCALSSPKLTRP